MPHNRKFQDIDITVFQMPDEFGQLSRVSGIYFLILGDEIDYIGRSVNVGNRLTSHHVFNRNKHKEVWVYEMEHKDDLIQPRMEHKLIRNFDPPNNKASLPKR